MSRGLGNNCGRAAVRDCNYDLVNQTDGKALFYSSFVSPQLSICGTIPSFPSRARHGHALLGSEDEEGQQSWVRGMGTH